MPKKTPNPARDLTAELKDLEVAIRIGLQAWQHKCAVSVPGITLAGHLAKHLVNNGFGRIEVTDAKDN